MSMKSEMKASFSHVMINIDFLLSLLMCIFRDMFQISESTTIDRVDDIHVRSRTQRTAFLLFVLFVPFDNDNTSVSGGHESAGTSISFLLRSW
jgi:hypothetical protein